MSKSRVVSKFRAVVAFAIGLLAMFVTVQPVHANTEIFLEEFGASWTPGTQWLLAEGSSFTALVNTDGSQTPNSALRLTSASQQKAGGLLYKSAIPTEFGLDISFHFSMWGGNGADGINFFLQKGTETSSRMPPGGTLGYSADRNQTPNLNGLSGGLVGIGFDMYGNHGNASFDGTGCASSTRPGANALVIRGPGDLMAGYCILGTLKQVSDTTTAVNTKWDHGTSSRAGRARSVRIVLDTATVSPRQLKIWLCASGQECAVTGAPAIAVNAPAELISSPTVRFGFAAATGGYTNNHEIWGLRIRSQVPVTYSLSYDLGGGTGTVPAAVSGLSAGASTTLAAGTGLTRAGFTFGGWTCDNSIGDKSAGSALTQPSANVVCTAKWVANTATVGDAPAANNDKSSGPRGATQIIDPLKNDGTGGSSVWASASMRLCGAKESAPRCTLKKLTVDGEGTYTVNAKNRVIFAPEASFVGKTTSVRYQVADREANVVSASISIVVSGDELPATGFDLHLQLVLAFSLILAGLLLARRMSPSGRIF